MNNQIVKHESYSLEETMRLGDVLAKSGMFTDARGAAQAVAKILAGRELGFGPIASMTGIYMVKGRITLSANLIAAAIKRSGRYDYRVASMTREGCELTFHEGDKVIGSSSFTMEDAAQAGLANGDNWKKYPRNMLFARALSNGAKWYTPDIFGGPVYTPEELGAQVDGETGEPVQAESDEPVVNVQPRANGNAPQAPQLATEEQKKKIDDLGMSNWEAPHESMDYWLVGYYGHGFDKLTYEEAEESIQELRALAEKEAEQEPAVME